MSKPWVALTEASISSLPAQLGVYQTADADMRTIKIGYAGATEPFGMRSALTSELDGGAKFFRHEFTHGYMTRWQELLMVYHADHGELPAANADRVAHIGRLTPGGATS